MRTHALLIHLALLLHCGAQEIDADREITRQESIKYGPFGIHDLIANRFEYAKLGKVIVSGILYEWGGRLFLIESLEKRSALFVNEWIPLKGRHIDRLRSMRASHAEWNLQAAQIRGRISFRFEDVAGSTFHPMVLTGVTIDELPSMEDFGELDFDQPLPEHSGRAEQDGADQPATAVESKVEGEEKPKTESDGRSQ